MTENTSRTRTPEDINRGINIPVQAAIAASAPPKALDPTSPINIEALYLLWKRKPIQAPAIDAPKIARSVQKNLRILSTQEMLEYTTSNYSINYSL